MERMNLEQLLARGKRPILVEFDPPRQTGADAFLRGAQELYQAGADAITIADCPTGKASIDACMLAAKFKREYGIEALPHMACRDRNLNAVKALLLGLTMEGVGSVLLITGDPVAHEDREQIKGVFQLNSRTLARSIGQLTASGQLAPFFLCGALNINARNFDQELEKARQKEESGIRAFLTQPVSSREAIEHVFQAREKLHGRLLAGLFPMVSYKNACFLQRGVSGVRIDPQILARYEGLDREAGEALGYQICLDAAREIRTAVDGYYIMTPFQRIELVKKIMAGLRGMEECDHADPA